MRSKLLKCISVRLPDDLLKKVDERCGEKSISRSSLFRAALEDQLEAKQDTEEKFANCT